MQDDNHQNTIPIALYPPPRTQSPSRHKPTTPSANLHSHATASPINFNFISGLASSQANKNPREQNLETSPNSKMTYFQQEHQLPSYNSNDYANQQSLNSSQTTKRNHNSSQKKNQTPYLIQQNRQNRSSQRSQICSVSNLQQLNPQLQGRIRTPTDKKEQRDKNEKTITLSNKREKQSVKNFHHILGTYDTLKDISCQAKQSKREQIRNIHVEDQPLQLNLSQQLTKNNLNGLNDSIGSFDAHPLIWNHDQYELNDQQISNLCHKDTQSQDSQPELMQLQLAPKQQSTPIDVFCQNTNLKQQVSHLSQQLTLTKQLKQHLQMKNHEYQMLKEINLQRYQDIEEQHKELNNLIQQYKEEAYRSEMTIKHQKKYIGQLQSQIDSLERNIQRRDEQIAELHLVIGQKNAELNQGMTLMKQIQEYVKEKAVEFDKQLANKQNQINQLTQTITFYQERLEQDGFTFNIEEIRQLQEVFEQQMSKGNEIRMVQGEYKRIIKTLEKDKEHQQKLIRSLVKKMEREGEIKDQRKYDELMNYINQIMQQYDLELKQRDQQIVTLKTQLKLHKEIQLQHCQPYLKQINNLSSLLLSSQLHQLPSAQLAVQFIYIVNKLSHMFMLAQRRSNGLEKDQQKRVKLMEEKDKLHQQELEAVYWDLQQTEKENYILGQKYQFLRAKYHALLYRQSQQRDVIEEEEGQPFQMVSPGISSLASSMIISRNKPENSQPLHQSCSIVKTNNTLEQLLTKRLFPSSQKLKLSLALVEFGQKMLKQYKKPISFKPNQITVSTQDGKYQFQLIKNLSRRSRQSQKSLFYAAPEVLLGFSQSEQSYVWTLGLIIDELFHDSYFYKKINEITSRQENYKCRDEGLEVKQVLEYMLKKKQKQRISIEKVIKQFQQLSGKSQ